jgi:hypothetical protein
MESTIHCPRCEQEVDASEASCPACGHLHGEKPACARHPERTAHGTCVVCSDAVCDDCDEGESVHFACPAHRAVPVIQGWAQIYSTSDTVEAGLIRENLESEGIDAAVFDQKDRSFNVDMGDLSPVRLLVPAFEYQEAMKVLHSHMDAHGEVAFACPACGEAYEVGDTACRTCNAALPGPAA